MDAGSRLAPVLPQTAVLNDAAGEFVYVLGAGDKAERRAVTVGGAREDGVIVASGLKAGERVVAVAGPYLRAGEPVRVAE